MDYILTFVPPALIILWIVRSDKFPEPLNNVVICFLIGASIALVAGVVNQIVIFSKEAAASWMFMAGFTEEPLKWIALYAFLRKTKAFNEPMDAVVYGTVISLGFATLENYEYVFFLGYPSTEIAILRAFTAIPLHAACGVLMGYYFGLYFFKRAKFNLIKALLIPSVAHATYNLTISFPAAGIVVLLAILGLSRGLHKSAKEAQAQQEAENQEIIR